MTLGEARYDSRPWGQRLQDWRENIKHWSRDDFREEVEATSYKLKEARGNRLHNRLIKRWEDGDVKAPQKVYIRILAQMGAPLPEVRGLDSESHKDSEEEAEMDRRRFLQSAGSAVAAAVVAPGGSYGGRQVPAKVDMAMVRGIRASVDELYRRDQVVGGASLAQAALASYYDARQMLDQADYGEDVGRELMTIAGELAVCVGWLSYDAGDQRQARDLYAEAFLLADQANDPRLTIQAVEKMALQSVFIADRGQHRGAAREAARLGERLTDLSRFQSSPRLHALVGGRQAIAFAVSGDSSEFRRAITRSWREIDQAGNVVDEETWLQFVTPGEITVHEAKGYRYLGNPTKAAKLYRASLENIGLSPRNRANYQAQLAATLVSIGDIPGALSEGRAALANLAGTIASPRTVTELSVLRRAAAARDDDEFCQQYDSLSGAGVA